MRSHSLRPTVRVLCCSLFGATLIAACTGTGINTNAWPREETTVNPPAPPGDAQIALADSSGGVVTVPTADASTNGFDASTTPVVDANVTPPDPPANCVACSGKPPALSRSYTDGQLVCNIDGNDSGPVYAGVEAGDTYYLYMIKPGQGCPDDRCIIYNREPRCLDLAGIPQSDALTFAVPHPGHPKTGWRPPTGQARSFCENKKICTWDVDSREVRARVKGGQLYYEWLEGGVWKSAGNGLLANIANACREDGGGTLPKYAYLCFTDASFTP